MYNAGKHDLNKQVPIQRRPDMLWVVASLLVFTFGVAASCYGYAWSSGSSVGSDGTIYGWGVTDGTPPPGYSMTHDAYVKTTLTSPKGRTASTGYGNYKWGVNTVRADLSLSFDATDLGTYTVQSFHRVHCIVMGWVLYDAPSSSSVYPPWCPRKQSPQVPRIEHGRNLASASRLH
jgi:hypothetical protein